jgi:hypothetical protein
MAILLGSTSFYLYKIQERGKNRARARKLNNGCIVNGRIVKLLTKLERMPDCRILSGNQFHRKRNTG